MVRGSWLAEDFAYIARFPFDRVKAFGETDCRDFTARETTHGHYRHSWGVRMKGAEVWAGGSWLVAADIENFDYFWKRNGVLSSFAVRATDSESESESESELLEGSSRLA